MKIIRDERQRAEPGRERSGEAGRHETDRAVQPATPARPQFRRQQRIGLQQALTDFFNRRQQQRDAQQDEEGELKARLKELLRVPEQNDEARSSE